MFYAFAHTVLTTHIVTAPARVEMELTEGVIHQVDVLFESGCNYLANVQIWQGGHQLWPSNRGKTLTGNAIVVSFREFHELTAGKNDLHALIWGDGVIDSVQVVIQMGLLPKSVLMPMSFKELLRAATGV